MALFGPDPAEIRATQPMVDWINQAPPGDLAVELIEAFTQTGPGTGGELTHHDLIRWMLRISSSWTTYYSVKRPIVEAVQLLEHSELIVYTPLLGPSTSRSMWTITRFGLAKFADGKPAVRQHIRDRTGQ